MSVFFITNVKITKKQSDIHFEHSEQSNDKKYFFNFRQKNNGKDLLEVHNSKLSIVRHNYHPLNLLILASYTQLRRPFVNAIKHGLAFDP